MDIYKEAILFRIESVINYFHENHSVGSLPCDCDFVTELYWMSYANLMILNSNGWEKELLPVISAVTDRCKTLLAFYETIIKVPDDKNLGFMEYAKTYCAHYDSIEDAVFTEKELLLKLGYREIDMDLCVAGENFDLQKVRQLLQRGADPSVEFPCEITEEDLPVADDDENIERYSLLSQAGMYASDFIDVSEGLKYWRAAASGVDIDICDNYGYLMSLLQSASYQVLLDEFLLWE